jgi:predicted Ser/Thr protein kinase
VPPQRLQSKAKETQPVEVPKDWPPQKPKSEARLAVARMVSSHPKPVPEQGAERLDRKSQVGAEALSPPKKASAGDSGMGLLDRLAAEEEASAPPPPADIVPLRPRTSPQAPGGFSSQPKRRTTRIERTTLIGKDIRGCEVIRKIGEGGMGTVFEARQRSLDRPVAVKVLAPELQGNRDFIDRLEDEAKILARVNHPNILHVYDFGEENALGVYFMTMEFVDGSDLTELLNRRGRLGEVECLEIIRQSALGLDCAAQRGIIHRDIKPDNLMLTKDGICKVSDFGLATDVHHATEEGDVSRTSRVGTPAFMSPEQCQGGKVDVRSDMYSLGCSAFVALAGRLPFQADSPFELMLQHRTFPVPSLRAEVPDLDPEVEGLVHRMMAKRPGERFSSMAELVKAIKEIIDRLLTREPKKRGKETKLLEPEQWDDLPGWMNG